MIEFGVELYDLIDIIKGKCKTSMLSIPSLFNGIESQIQQYLKVRLTVEISMLERHEKKNLGQPKFYRGKCEYGSKEKSGLGNVTGAFPEFSKGVTSSITSGLGKLSSDDEFHSFLFRNLLQIIVRFETIIPRYWSISLKK
jgi:hypothetical protein